MRAAEFNRDYNLDFDAGLAQDEPGYNDAVQQLWAEREQRNARFDDSTIRNVGGPDHFSLLIGIKMKQLLIVTKDTLKWQINIQSFTQSPDHPLAQTIALLSHHSKNAAQTAKMSKKSALSPNARSTSTSQNRYTLKTQSGDIHFCIAHTHKRSPSCHITPKRRANRGSRPKTVISFARTNSR
jgi:hypothetical protein